MLIAFWDIESNGLLVPKADRGGVITPPMNRVHTVTMILVDGADVRYISACDQPGWEKGQSHVDAYGRLWEHMPIVDALILLQEADLRVAHNGQDFDERAIRKIYPWFKPKPGSAIIDTMIASRAIYPDIHRSGPNTHLLPGFLKVAHSLKAWGLRLGEHKGDYTGGWAVWNHEMQSYGEQDTVVLWKLFKWLMHQHPAKLMMQIEHGFAGIIRRQETRGMRMDHPKALALLAKLTEREQELESSLITTFGEWWEFGKPANAKAGSGKDGSSFDEDEDMEDPEEQERRRAAWAARQRFDHVIVPTATRQVKMVGFPDVTRKRFSDKTGKEVTPYVGPPKITYTQGAAYTPIKRVQFNPSSRTHIRKRLIAMYGWEPIKFTKGGKKSPPQPVVDDDVLQSLPWPEAQLLAEYYLVLKRIGMLATGKKAWLRVARETELPNGQKVYRIHGRVNTNGAVTGRCTHSDPNMAQVPKNSAGKKAYPNQPFLWGEACRDLFIPGEGYELVGFDAAALELRMAAHYMHRWDGGDYAKRVDEGVHYRIHDAGLPTEWKEDVGTDPHSWMRTSIIGEDVVGAGDPGRDNAKTGFYAYLFGGGKERLGLIVLPHGSTAEKIAIGGRIKDALEVTFVALAQLKAAIEEAVEENKCLTGLDGRILRVRKAHAALNTLLQSAGAVVMKLSLVLLDKALQAAGLTPGDDYEFVANVHDEAQAEVKPQHVPLFKRLAEQAVADAGTKLGLNCPLKAEASHGPSWKFTH
jgi:DNA polymerase-1